MSAFGSQQFADSLKSPGSDASFPIPEFLRDDAIKKAESLFKRSTRLLLVPVLYQTSLGRSMLNLVVMDRADWKSHDYFKIPLPGTAANYVTVSRGGINESICPHIEIGTRNWEISIAFAHMLTLCGYDIYLFSIDDKTALINQISQGHIHDFRSDIFNPSGPPKILFVMTGEDFSSTFGFCA